MNQGEIVERGLVDVVLADPQADYTKNLLADTPDVVRTTASRDLRQQPGGAPLA